MRPFTAATVCLFGALAIVLVAMHSPGEMSVDSVMALYEAAKGHAIGWGPTFMAATLAWLGGGAIGASLFVAITCALTYGCFVALLIYRTDAHPPHWQLVIALLLSLNPLFMFYVGIVWKDVMQATIAMVSATLLLLAAHRCGRSRYVLLGFAAVAAGMLIPVRQQGILIALPLAIGIGWLAVYNLNLRITMRVLAFVTSVGIVIACGVVFYVLAAATVKPQAHGPVSVGIYTIQAYDIAGMIANDKSGGKTNWSGASQLVQDDIRANYSPERIDTIWHLQPVRDYFNSLSGSRYMSIWLRGIKHNPRSYLKIRLDAFSYLLGTHDIKGCVPSFWGIGAIQYQVDQLGLVNGMDSRARAIGHAAIRLYATPVFRNWFYALLLGLVSCVAVFRISGDKRAAAIFVVVACWLYWLSFLPTTIACDFRYLYPVDALATVLWVYSLTHATIVRRAKMG